MKALKMNRISLVLLVAIASIALTGCGTRVVPNHAGVLMSNYGKAGKEDFSLQKGMVSDFWPSTHLYQVPLFEQRAKFEAQFRLKASDNTEFTSQPTYSFKVIESRAVDVVFENKHLGNGNGGDEFMKSLEDNILETKIYDLMKEASRRHTTDDLMATGGSLKFEESVQELVRADFEKKGLELVTFSAQLNFSDKVTDKIDKRNEVNTNISVLDQQITEQRKKNELEELIKDQNLIKSAGLSPLLIQQLQLEVQSEFIRKWDGKSALYGSTPLTVLRKE